MANVYIHPQPDGVVSVRRRTDRNDDDYCAIRIAESSVMTRLFLSLDQAAKLRDELAAALKQKGT